MTVSSTPAAQLQAPQNERIPNRTLEQKDFLNLLITQLGNQNPMKPTDGNEMLAQMTQIASIQSMNAMQKSMTDLQTNNQVNLGQNLINKMVQVWDEDVGKPVIGLVDKVSMSKGVVSLTVSGHDYPINALEAVIPPPPSQTP